jgi:hypothetical protein
MLRAQNAGAGAALSLHEAIEQERSAGNSQNTLRFKSCAHGTARFLYKKAASRSNFYVEFLHLGV